MRWIALAALLASTPVEAHCYSHWYYPWPQRCGVARQGQFRTISDKFGQAQIRANSRKSAAPEILPKIGIDIEILLPSLARADLDGGEADEPTRARILLRAALEASNGH